ncbi:homocysteine S-methyltransferase family protein [Desulfolutivibrio sulfoxidireducens]|uniref:homocysteine S-methyltransferase family protein n=1 Tax=Desulfolutivibrio sulfoxidireducens TaxID=2773299 RepID=UPI00159D1D4E|nr:homocysteine S-methyltransferase family protein [Desulfolutivibrio sulfoxidireducens]QLA16950.1 methionine synthase [Desulfolutivibrio sulfoxidireducens]
MNRARRALASGEILIFDGATGTLLQQRGLPPGQSPELFGLTHPEAVRTSHLDYIRAGARAVTSNTFGGSRFKLPPGTDVTALNRRMAEIAREAAGDDVLVVGSIGPTGKFVQPMGELTLRELVDVFAEQVRGLAQGGADMIIAETHFDLAEAKAMVLACHQVCDLPVAVCMTFEGLASLTGTTPLVFADTMRNLGVDLLGVNCGLGPAGMMDVVRDWLARASMPFLVKPNAGLPRLENGRTVFPMGPEEFAAETAGFVDLGAKVLCGCCGTTPAHIAALARAVSGRPWRRPEAENPLAVTSRSRTVAVGGAHPLAVIGERVNPTGKPVLTAELQAGELSEALRLASEQVESGAAILDVNVGAPMVVEAEILPRLVQSLIGRVDAPLCLDSNDIAALTAGLWAYPGSALVNSISGEPGRMELLGPLCKHHGAPFILLPLEGRKLPVTAAERLGIVERLVDKALGLGIPKHLIMVDALALTVSSKSEAALACFETIRHCREAWGLPTCLGLSNISFGLPARELVNSTFLAMCMGSGLAAVIANPNSARLRETAFAAEVLRARDPQAGRFIASYAGWRSGNGGGAAVPGQGAGNAAGGAPARGPAATLRQAVIQGDKAGLPAMIEAALASGRAASEILNGELIPGILEVGQKYEHKEYFLPQLLLSAETMRLGFDRLRPLLADASEGEGAGRIVMATVEGDIHDIGKNIVCLMLANHGYEVVDLGKDVPAERIVGEALDIDADVIGLSALMTTTMVRMADTVRLRDEKGCRARIMVGGAVVTDAFAASIGADGYSPDAVGAVREAARLVGAARGCQSLETC